MSRIAAAAQLLHRPGHVQVGGVDLAVHYVECRAIRTGQPLDAVAVSVRCDVSVAACIEPWAVHATVETHGAHVAGCRIGQGMQDEPYAEEQTAVEALVLALALAWVPERRAQLAREQARLAAEEHMLLLLSGGGEP